MENTASVHSDVAHTTFFLSFATCERHNQFLSFSLSGSIWTTFFTDLRLLRLVLDLVDTGWCLFVLVSSFYIFLLLIESHIGPSNRLHCPHNTLKDYVDSTTDSS